MRILYLLPLAAFLTSGCEKRGCYKCVTTREVEFIGMAGGDTTAYGPELICDYTEEEIRIFEYNRSSIHREVENGVGQERRILVRCIPK